jgi:hypothetical protein
MNLSKLNYITLNEEFCFWYFKVYNKFPDKSTKFSKAKLIKHIWYLKRSHRSQLKEKSNENIHYAKVY